jgi:hypothetical protein
VTGIYTTARIAHLIAAGNVTQHLAPVTRAHEGRLPWMPGKSHAVIPLGRQTLCRVIVHRLRHVELGALQPRDLHETGHRTTLDLARWWLRTSIARQERTGDAWSDEQILARFARHKRKVAWALEFALDTSHLPRLLHEDPAQGYTALTQQAAVGEPEAVSAWEVERQVDGAQARHAARRGLIEQQRLDEHATLEQRLERALTRAAEHGIDVRAERRVLEQRIHRIERKIAGAA